MHHLTTILLGMLAGAAIGAPQFGQQQLQYTTPVPIVQQSQDGPNPDGSYQYSYSTGNGINGRESGYLKNAGTADEAQVAEGSVSYTAPDGSPISLNYVADEGGFRVEGAHLPTPPPIPEAIRKALEFINSQPQQYDDNGFPIQSAPRPNFG